MTQKQNLIIMVIMIVLSFGGFMLRTNKSVKQDLQREQLEQEREQLEQEREQLKQNLQEQDQTIEAQDQTIQDLLAKIESLKAQTIEKYMATGMTEEEANAAWNATVQPFAESTVPKE